MADTSSPSSDVADLVKTLMSQLARNLEQMGQRSAPPAAAAAPEPENPEPQPSPARYDGVARVCQQMNRMEGRLYDYFGDLFVFLLLGMMLVVGLACYLLYVHMMRRMRHLVLCEVMQRLPEALPGVRLVKLVVPPVPAQPASAPSEPEVPQVPEVAEVAPVSA